MTKREQQHAILLAYANGDRTTEQTLDALNALDKEADVSFYSMIRQLDADRHLLAAAQGNPAEQIMGIDRIISHMTKHAERIEGEK